MHFHGILWVAMSCLASLLAPPANSGTGDQWIGPLVLNVGGKSVKLTIDSSSYAAGEEGSPPTFHMDSTSFVLAGDFDLNGDGKADENDKPSVDGEGKLRPNSLVNKKVLLHETEDDGGSLQNFVELPGLGQCAVLKGSVLTITRYKKTGKEVDRWSGTVSLKLKPEKGANSLQVNGQFECGVQPE